MGTLFSSASMDPVPSRAHYFWNPSKTFPYKTYLTHTVHALEILDKIPTYQLGSDPKFRTMVKRLGVDSVTWAEWLCHHSLAV